jgi:hypothetical protein
MLSPSLLVEQATTHVETNSAVRKPRAALGHSASLFVFMCFLHERWIVAALCNTGGNEYLNVYKVY